MCTNYYWYSVLSLDSLDFSCIKGCPSWKVWTINKKYCTFKWRLQYCDVWIQYKRLQWVKTSLLMVQWFSMQHPELKENIIFFFNFYTKSLTRKAVPANILHSLNTLVNFHHTLVGFISHAWFTARNLQFIRMLLSSCFSPH